MLQTCKALCFLFGATALVSSNGIAPPKVAPSAAYVHPLTQLRPAAGTRQRPFGGERSMCMAEGAYLYFYA